MSEAQTLFETIVRHLFAQGEKSTKVINGKERCAYRGSNGLMCAVGCVIPDDLYVADFDIHNMAVGEMTTNLAKSDTKDLIVRNKDLLANLQAVHDDARNWETSENMTNALIKVGTMFCLKVEFIDQCYFGMTK